MGNDGNIIELLLGDFPASHVWLPDGVVTTCKLTKHKTQAPLVPERETQKVAKSLLTNRGKLRLNLQGLTEKLGHQRISITTSFVMFQTSTRWGPLEN